MRTPIPIRTGHKGARNRTLSRILVFPGIAVFCLYVTPLPASDLPFWRQIVENRLEKIRSGKARAPVLRWRQVSSLNYAHYRPGDQPAVSLPDTAEVDTYHLTRSRSESEALVFLDELFGERDDLKALAVRDSDGDGVPDYRVSDYFGKFMEGDLDLDGDGILNTLDSHPNDPAWGGQDGDGDGIPDVAGSFRDENTNGMPDHIDWAMQGRDPEFGELQRRLLREHKIALVDRDAEFDLPLLRAVDDVVGRVFRSYFERRPVMPTLRTIAVEKTALLGRLLSNVVEDNTSAQVFSQTQSLTIYDDGRDIPHEIGLLGLLVHEIGHNYHMALDFRVDDVAAENGRTRFTSPAFIRMIAPFGWINDGYYEGTFAEVLPVMPRFAYTGISEPLFRFNDKTPEQWSEWLLETYEGIGSPAEYLQKIPFSSRYIVSDYSLTSPYEWYGDNLLAYVVLVLERETLDVLAGAGRGEDADTDKRRIDEAMRQIWPGFYHRNIAPDVFAYFEQTFPIVPEDRRFLARRYVFPLLEHPPG